MTKVEIKHKVEELLADLPLRKMKPMEANYLHPSIEEFEAKAKAEFSKYLDPHYVERNFLLQDDFKEYLIQCKNYYHTENHWSFLFDSFHIIQNFTYFLDTFGEDVVERRKKNLAEENDTMWIYFGGWSDKHDYVISCDKTSQVFGKVFDGHDAHPWLNENLFGVDDVLYDTFLEFLEKEIF